MKTDLLTRWLSTSQRPDDAADTALWGGKGAGLLRLAAWGVKVPPFFVLSSELFRSGSPDDLLAAIREGLGQLPAGPVAVRSSAVDEDGGRHSLAGQMDTFLYVPAEPSAVAEQVRACWASLRSERAIAYRRHHGLNEEHLAMAVVVQTMVPADRSLVAFSANPMTRDPDEMLVSASWGLGDGLVSGAVDADTYVLAAHDGALKHKEVSEQATMSAPAPEGGVSLQPIAAECQGQAVLGQNELHGVWELARHVAARFDCPVDIEAAFADGQLYCLQARPITSPIGGRKLLWDNSNIVESYSGVTTPLTFSHANNCYKVVYTIFGRMLGVPREVHEANERGMQTYLGLQHGRVYYNLLTWYLSMAHLPGYGFTRGAMENMMGVKEALDVDLPAIGSPLQKWTQDFPKLASMLGRTAWSFLTLDKMIARFEANFAAVYGTYQDESFEGWDADRLVTLYHDLIYKVLYRWQAPIMTDIGAMVSMALLQKLCTRWIPDAPGLANSLLVGDGGIESTEPTRRLLELAGRLRDRPTALSALAQGPEAFLAALKTPELQDLGVLWADWLRRYGDRTMNELKLEEPSFHERPDFVIAMLRNYVSLPAAAAAALQPRNEAETQLKTALRGRPLQALLLNKVLGWTRRHVRNRENMRFTRTRLTGMVRRLFLGVGRDFSAQGVLRSPQDVFYLTIDEITAYVDGRSVTRDLQALTDMRRAEFEQYQGEEPPERFVTLGLPHRHVTPPSTDVAPEDGLSGTPCCAGVVEGPTKLIRDPQGDMTLAGEILVAPRTDPGWVALYPAISGLLVEKGSVLSHSAIVAREMGLPAIVGIKGLCRLLDQGQRVRMDGATGRIEILDDH